jgi:hypothetical protein
MQARDDLQAADARLQPFAGGRAKSVIFVGVGLTLLFTFALLGTAFILTSETGVRALGMDMRVFWAAGRLALDGEPLATFDMQRLSAEHNVNPTEWMPWLYPPGYLVLILPFGAMSFSVAFLVSTLLSVALVALAARPFVAGIGPVWLAMALAPAYLPALLIGQNSLIWLGGLLAALAALRSGRWVLAGVFIGCLTLKPQLGLMIPLALLAAGLWRTIFAASATAIVLAALPTLAFGLDYWPLLADRLSEHSEHLLLSITNLFLSVGPFYLGTVLGLSAELALKVQWAVTAAVAVAVVVFWRSDRIGFDAKAALLMIAILLSAPYLWYYEAAIMAAIGLFMTRAGILTTSPPHLILLILLWFGAGLQAMNIYLDVVPEDFPGAIIVTPVLFVSLALCLRHFLAARRPATGPA